MFSKIQIFCSPNHDTKEHQSNMHTSFSKVLIEKCVTLIFSCSCRIWSAAGFTETGSRRAEETTAGGSFPYTRHLIKTIRKSLLINATTIVIKNSLFIVEKFHHNKKSLKALDKLKDSPFPAAQALHAIHDDFEIWYYVSQSLVFVVLLFVVFPHFKSLWETSKAHDRIKHNTCCIAEVSVTAVGSDWPSQELLGPRFTCRCTQFSCTGQLKGTFKISV